MVFNNGYAVLSESGTGKSDGVIEEIKNLSAKDLFSFKLFEYSYDELTSAIEDNPEFVLEKTSLFSELAINSFEADLENLSNINIVDFEEKISKNMTQLLKDMDFDHLIPK
ncbi:hypothetical protein F1737_03460 [Methanoplanus sp. FWC-SCC4]|uniref:Uncharacterized protein n=1 Tax=Methanochimaera problematica TaxID=2609417 RepID=A0AA97FE68_9EURY|nr:hypothetical protein [Methanoplanus sp. FWC-SCC4]WOF15816.1 hypothetical protein F1737_03460 [Methanoplanus sp. FWC-SCC4]